MAETGAPRPLAPGRAVNVLPRTGGPSWPATVRAWEAAGASVSVALEAARPAVEALDHHQVWLSTVGRDSEGSGVTIFVGRAWADEEDGLRVNGVVRMAEEPRRSAVRAANGTVTLLPQGGAERTVRCLDISRGGVRLPVGREGWVHEDPVDLVVHLERGHAVNVVGRLHRLDAERRVVVLRFDPLSELDGGELDRYAIARLRRTQARATRSA